jgi:CheY-like chemotaxis protein
MKILFLEDNQNIADLFFLKLGKTEHKIDHVKRGKDGMALLTTTEYDLVICDHYMPTANGDKVYEFMRKHKDSINKETKFFHFSSMPKPKTYHKIDPNFDWQAKDFNSIQSLIETRLKT